MSINKYINAVKNAPIIMEEHDEMDTVIKIKVYNQEFIGVACCCEEDAEFFSPIVGGTIAHFRAMENALFYKIWETEDGLAALKHCYACLTQNMNPAIADPTGKFKTYIYKQENKLNKLRKARRKLKIELYKYISDQSKAIDSLQRSRAKSDN